MFSQRNNPYCELLHFSMTNIKNKHDIQVSFQIFFVRFVANITLNLIVMKRILGLDFGDQ